MGAGDVSLMFRLLGDSGGLVDATEEAGDATEQLGDRFGKLKEVTAVAGLAAGAALMAGISSGLEQGQLTAKLGAQLGLGADEAQRFGKLAGSVYADGFGADVAQVNDAIKGVYQNIGEGNDAWVQEITAQVLTVADVFEQDLGGTTAAVGQMLRTGLAKDATEALDILTAGLQSGADKSGDLLDTFNEYGTQFRKVGLDGKASMGLLSQGLQAGARDADIVADAIKEFSIRSQEKLHTLDSKGRPQMTALGDAFHTLGMDGEQAQAAIAAGGPGAAAALDQVLDRLRGIEDPTIRARTAVALFGTQAEDLGAALFALDPSSATQALGQVSGAAERASDAMGGTAAARIEVFKRAITQGFTEAAGGVIGWVDTHRTAVATVGVAIGALTLLVAAHNVATTLAAAGGLRAWVMSTQLATAAQWLWNAAISANPIGLMIIAIAALVAGLVWFFTQTTLGRAIFSTAMQGISTAFGWVWDKATALFGWVRSNWPTLLTILTGPIGLAVLAITKHWDTIMALPGKAKAKISEVGKTMWQGIWLGFRTYINMLISGWNRLNFSVPGFSAFGVSVPGFNLGVPKIPMLAAGGIVSGPTLAVIGEAGPEAVVPLDRAGDFGGRGGPDINVYVTAGAVGSEDYLVRVISDAIGQVAGQGGSTGAFAGASY